MLLVKIHAMLKHIDFDTIRINNEEVSYTLFKAETIVDEETLTSYKALDLYFDKALSNQEIVDLNFYYNKQRIIIKIKNKIFS